MNKQSITICILFSFMIYFSCNCFSNNFARRFDLNSYITQNPLWFKKPKQDDNRIQQQKNIDKKNKSFDEKIEKDRIRSRLEQKATTRKIHHNN
ncbi:MAG TPA: hypothetical protein PLU71_00320 [Candidatus Dependentiae bacterium]|nr:hypothetical protein [Candidatus Dependentiae bacterium]HRQ62282.1 hypothetical protein [Candidatus Dependentiae bacterium]